MPPSKKRKIAPDTQSADHQEEAETPTTSDKGDTKRTAEQPQEIVQPVTTTNNKNAEVTTSDDKNAERQARFKALQARAVSLQVLPCLFCSS